MIPLTNKELESYFSEKNSHLQKKGLKTNTLMIKNIVKLEITVIIQVNTEVLHITYVI